MKFVVTKTGYNEYDIQMNWKTKSKIEKILGWTSCAILGAGAAWFFVVKPRQNEFPKK